MKGFHSSMTTLRVSEAKTSPRLGARTLAENNHEVNDYGLSKAISTHLQRRKKKKKVQVYSDSASHCQSLEKLQLLHREKNDEIKRYIYQKAEIQAENEELKQMVCNPTMREHQLHSRISELEEVNRRLTAELERREKEHRQEIERMRSEHRTQIELINDGYRTRNEHAYQNKTYIETKSDYRKPDHNPRVFEPTQTVRQTYEEPKTYQTQGTFENRKFESRANINVSDENSHPKTYVAGSPVYISANRSVEEKGGNFPKAIPTNSTQFLNIRGESPKILSYSQSSPIEQLSPPHQATRIGSRTDQQNPPPRVSQPTNFSYRVNIKPAESEFVQKYPSESKEASRAGKVSYAESDLQEIYKKYCIND